MQVVLEIAYNGTRYSGWQLQPNVPTVQGAIEEALQQLLGTPTRVMGASRTDTGVHALQQMAQFRTDARIPPDKYRLALLPFLPADVVVTSGREAPEDFWILNAVETKTYRYVYHIANVAHPLLEPCSWRVYPPLNIEAMQEAAAILLGKQDFACFESSGSPRGNTVRTISRSDMTKIDAWSPITMPRAADGGGQFLVYEVTGDGFLYNMVRAIAGTLLAVGRGRFEPSEIAEIIASKDRSLARETAPPHGLTLTEVNCRPSAFVLDASSDSAE